MKKETRGLIEQAIDRIGFGFKDIEAYEEITTITNREEFLLGYTLGYLRRFSELVVLWQAPKMTKTDEREIGKIILTRTPEIRKKLKQYLNK